MASNRRLSNARLALLFPFNDKRWERIRPLGLSTIFLFAAGRCAPLVQIPNPSDNARRDVETKQPDRGTCSSLDYYTTNKDKSESLRGSTSMETAHRIVADKQQGREHDVRFLRETGGVCQDDARGSMHARSRRVKKAEGAGKKKGEGGRRIEK